MLSAAAMFGSILYIPVFFQMVLGQSATNSGLILLPLMAGIVFGSIVSGQIVSRTGKYRLVGLLGFSIATVGMFLLSRITTDSTNAQVSWEMVVLGLGLGPSLPLMPLIVQNTFGPKDTSVVTGATQFFRTIGGAIGASVLGTVFNNQLTSSLKNLPGVGLPPQLMHYLTDPDYITSKTAIDKVYRRRPSHVPPANACAGHERHHHLPRHGQKLHYIRHFHRVHRVHGAIGCRAGAFLYDRRAGTSHHPRR